MSEAVRAFRLSFFSETLIHLSAFPLDPPLDAPQRARAHALVRLIRLPTELKLVDLQRAEQRASRQRERDLRSARGAQVRMAARERAPQRRGPARSRGGTGGTEVVEAEGASDQHSVRRAGTYIHSPPPVAPLHVAPIALEPR